MYIKRASEKLFTRYSSLFPCVAITGPRQSGKSTMVRHLLPNIPYVTFDDPQEEFAFQNDPEGFLSRFPDSVIFDEVQRVPELLRYLKIRIDKNPTKNGRFYLTGSNQLHLNRGISESLAGRTGIMILFPLERSEVPKKNRNDQIVFGSYPALVIRSFDGVAEWYSSYIATYLEKDIKQVFDIGKLADFKLFLRLVSVRTACEVNASSFSREIGVSSNTIDKWISIMEAGYIIFLLKPFFANLGKRLIKRPKIYFWDTGLVCSLTGVKSREILNQGPLEGPIFENFVISEMVKKSIHSGSDREFYFYRDNGGNEIDLIIHDRVMRRVFFVEIKAGHTAKPLWSEQLEKTASLLRASSSFIGMEFQSCIVYRGVTKTDWPKNGVSYLNFDDFLLL